uniref:Lipocalin n=1 Tax=Rhipicephalus appendiculatus TaxID=34631 RepID=A0A131YTF8_RHIAP
MHLKPALFLLKALIMQVSVIQLSASEEYVDFKEFLTSPPKTWTYRSTLDLPYDCRMDNIVNVTKVANFYYIYFNHSMRNSERIFSTIRYGRIFENYDRPGKPWNVMFITEYATGYASREMVFGIKEMCAVIKVDRFEDTFPSNYELLVKPKARRDPPEECLTKFKECAEKSQKTSYDVYKAECKSLYRKEKKTPALP